MEDAANEMTKRIWEAAKTWGAVTISDIDMVEALRYVVMQFAYSNIVRDEEKNGKGK